MKKDQKNTSNTVIEDEIAKAMKNLHINIFEPTRTGLAIEKGKFLISDPFLPGPIFDRSIVYIVEHGNEGTIGYIVNKPSNLYPDELIKDIYNFSGQLYIGGPVGETSVNFLHNLGALIPKSRVITKSISWGGDFTAVKALINLGVASADSIKFFVGYSVWAKGQLQDEIEDNAWIVADLPDTAILSNNTTHSWEISMRSLGGIFETWASFPKSPNHN